MTASAVHSLRCELTRRFVMGNLSNQRAMLSSITAVNLKLR